MRPARLFALAWLQAASHSEDPLPDSWYEAFRAARLDELRHLDRRLDEMKPKPATPPAGGDPEDVHIFVIGDWGTFPGTGINMRSAWSSSRWNSLCFMGARSQKEWEEAKRTHGITAKEVQDSFREGRGRPICGSSHLECSWNKGGVASQDRCNPDHPRYWRDHYSQQNVATAMTDLARQRKPSFVVNTADNFYFAGVESTHDDLWNMMFEELYPDESLQIPWLSSLGNHDYGGHDCDYCLFHDSDVWSHDPRRGKPCSQAMIDYDTEHDWQWPSPKEVRWVLPMKGEDRWYMKSFKFPKANVTIDVFVIDTNKAHVSSQCYSSCPKRFQSKCVDFFMRLWTRQRTWLLPALEQSKADWKMVVGHAPPENFEASLMEEMSDRGVSVYMAGHVHQLRHDRDPSGIEAIISGSGGGYQSAGGGTAYTLHETQDYGFATIHAEYNQLTIEYYNDEGTRLWEPIVVGRDRAQERIRQRILKKLREAAIALDVQTMKDQMAKAKENEVEQSFIDASALAGVKAFEGKGGMAWVHMKPALQKSGEATFSGYLAPWTLEDSLPTETSLFYPGAAGACCSDLKFPTAGFPAPTTVVCYPTPSCGADQMLAHVAKPGARAMLVVLPDPTQVINVVPLEDDTKLPVMGIPTDPVKNLPSWLGNPAEKISIELFGGERGFQIAVDAVRKAGLAEDVIEVAIRAARQRQAEEKLEAALRTSNMTLIQESLERAAQFEAESDLMEEAKRRLTMLRLQADLAAVSENCDQFPRVHELVEGAKALEVGNTTAAQKCRLKLALQALDAAVALGSSCQEPVAKAVAWCQLAEALAATITRAEEECASQVAAWRKKLTMIMGVAIIAAGAAGALCFCLRKKPAEATPAPERNAGGIELLEAS